MSDEERDDHQAARHAREEEESRLRKEEVQRRREERLRKEEEEEKREAEERAKREEERAARRAQRDTRNKQREVDTKKEIEEIEKRARREEERRKKKEEREARWLAEEQAAKDAEEKRRLEREARRIAEEKAEEELRQKKREMEEAERQRIEELLIAQESEEERAIRLEHKRRRHLIEELLSNISTNGEFHSPDESEREKQLMWFIDRVVEQDALRDEMQHLISEDSCKSVTELLSKPASILVLIKCITDTRDGSRLHEFRGELLKGNMQVIISPLSSPLLPRASDSPSVSPTSSGEIYPPTTLALCMARVEFCLNILTEGTLPVARIVSDRENHFLIDALFQMLKDNQARLPPPNMHMFMKVASSFMNRRPSEISDYYLAHSSNIVESLVRHIGSPEVTELIWKTIETEVMLKSEGLHVSEEQIDDEHMGSPNPSRFVGTRRIDEGSPSWTDKLVGGLTTKLQEMLDRWEEFGQKASGKDELYDWASYSADEVENITQICVDILNKHPRSRMARSILGHSFNNALVQLAFNLNPPAAPLSGALLTLIDLLLAQILKKQSPPPPAMSNSTTSTPTPMFKPTYKAPGLVLSLISPLANPDSSKSPLQIMSTWLAAAPEAPVPIPRVATPIASAAPRSPYVSVPVSKIATPSSPAPPAAAPSASAPTTSSSGGASALAPAAAAATAPRTAKSMRSPTPTPMDRGTNTPALQRASSQPTPPRSTTGSPSTSTPTRAYLNTPSLSLPSINPNSRNAPPTRARPSPIPSPLSLTPPASTPTKSATASTPAGYPSTPTHTPVKAPIRSTSDSTPQKSFSTSNLLVPTPSPSVPTTNGAPALSSATHVTRIVGVQRLRVLQCIGSLTKLEWDNVNIEGRLASSGALKSVVRLFFDFPSSTPVHTLVADMVRQLIKRCMIGTEPSPAASRLLEHILKDCGLVSGILNVLKGTAETCGDDVAEDDLPMEEYTEVYICHCSSSPCVCSAENNKGTKIDAEVIAPMLIAPSPKPVSKPAPESMPHIMAICQDLTRAALKKRWLLLIIKDCSGEDQWLDLVVLQKGLVFNSSPEGPTGWKSSPRPTLSRAPSKLKFVVPTPKVES